MAHLNRNEDPDFFDHMHYMGYIDETGTLRKGLSNRESETALSMIGFHHFLMRMEPAEREAFLARQQQAREDHIARRLLAQVFDDVDDSTPF